MARTTGKSGFKMRSGNGPLKFKSMGSSPVKQNIFSDRPGYKEKVAEKRAKFRSDVGEFVGGLRKAGQDVHEKLQKAGEYMSADAIRARRDARIAKKSEPKASNVVLSEAEKTQQKHKAIDEKYGFKSVKQLEAEHEAKKSNKATYGTENPTTTDIAKGDYGYLNPSQKIKPDFKTYNPKTYELDHGKFLDPDRYKNIEAGSDVHFGPIGTLDEGNERRFEPKNLKIKSSAPGDLEKAITAPKVHGPKQSKADLENIEKGKARGEARKGYRVPSSKTTKTETKVKTKVRTKKVKNPRKAGESQYQADVRARRERNRAKLKAKRAAEEKAKNAPVDLTKKTGLGPRA